MDQDKIVTTGSRWQELQLEMGRRLSKRLFEDLSREADPVASSGVKNMRWSLWLAYTLATLVYGLSVSFVALGLWVLWHPWPTLFHPIVGTLFALLGWAARPRPVQAPYYLLKRADFPILYTLTDRIAEALGAAKPQAIAYSAEFNANYRQAGWKRQPYIEMGAPLLSALNAQERLAVIAHELSHGVNKDPLHSNYLHGAVEALATWGLSVRPKGLGTLGEGMPYGPVVSLIGIPFELVMFALSELLLRLASGFLLLVLRQSQRAEYLADRLAGSVVGPQAMWQMLEKLYLEDSVSRSLRRHALTSPYEPIGDTISTAIAMVGADDLNALRTESLASEWQVDSSHPPTALRVKMLQMQTHDSPINIMSPDECGALDEEVTRVLKLTEREIINQHLERASY